MRLCLSIEIQEGMSYAETLGMAVAGEGLGFEAALLAEHYYPSGRPERYAGGPGSVMAADAWIYLAGMARETSRIRLGTLVSPVTFRHPAVLAKMAATLDHVSNGRAELGLGAGWLEPEHTAYGLPFPSAPRRVDLLEEQLQVIGGLFTRTPFNHHGAVYQLRDCHFTPGPVQQPRLPLIVGGSASAERLPRLAARYADEYVINSPSVQQCRVAREKLDRACQANGRDPASLRLSAFVAVCVGGSPSEADRHLELLVDSSPHYARMLDSRPNWIFGTPEQAQSRLDELAAAGIERALLSVNCELHRQMLPLLARREREPTGG